MVAFFATLFFQKCPQQKCNFCSKVQAFPTWGVAPQKGHFACHEFPSLQLIIFPSMQQKMGKNPTSTPRSIKTSGVWDWRPSTSARSLAISILALGSSLTYHVWRGRTLIFELQCCEVWKTEWNTKNLWICNTGCSKNWHYRCQISQIFVPI